MSGWLYLTIAIVSEVIATTSLKAAEGFTRLVPTILTVAGYLSAFYFLSLTLRTIPVGVAYAVWAGIGIVAISVVGWWLYDQQLDTAALLGMALIIAGVIVMNVFSSSLSA